MHIDKVSKKIVTIALYLDQKKPGSVSEIWLDKDLISELKKDASNIDNLERYVRELQNEINILKDKRRKKYLTETLSSVNYQLNLSDEKTIDLLKFTQNCFGIQIPDISDDTISEIDKQIEKLEKKIGKSREEIIKGSRVSNGNIKARFNKELNSAKKIVSAKLGIVSKKEKFTLKIVTGKNWSAFNKHVKPFESDLLINTDQTITKRDLHYLAYHEGYGGHHTELSLKDKLLVEEGRGEHGLVVTYSPQTFISEAIAVNSEVFFSDTSPDLESQLCDIYSEFTGGILLTRLVYMYHQKSKSKSEIKEYLNKLNITEESKRVIIGFVTDKIYGKYTLVYNFAEKFLYKKWQEVEDKQEFLETIYTQPTTPSML